MFFQGRPSPKGLLKKALIGGAAAKVLSSREKQKRSSGGLLKKAMLGGALGAAAFYFLDPNQGRTRRAKLRDQFTQLFNRSGDKVERSKQALGARAEALQARATAAAMPDSPPPSDPALQDKIESEVLTRNKYPKGQITLEVVDGVVSLRGEVEEASRRSQLEQDVRKVTGVVDVRNFLHLPGETPPNKEAAIRASR